MERVVVFGANGRVGSLVVEGLLAGGHTVKAFVHRKQSLPEDERIRVIEGDIHDSDTVLAALKDTDVVISALGSWGTSTKDILSSGMSSIIPGMRRLGISRIISLTGAEARASGDNLTILHRLAHLGAGLAAGEILEDGEAHIEMLERSGLRWTVLRSPVMNERGSVAYRLSRQRPAPWRTINRHAVAAAVIAQLDSEDYLGKAPFISR